MEHNDWLNKWRLNDIGFHQQDVDFNLVTYFPEWKPHPAAHILVPLCGKSRDMLWLAEKGYHITGVELSPIACKEFFSELGVNPKVSKYKLFTLYRHNNIELICGDLFALNADDLKPIHAIYDCGALVALPPETRKKYVKHLVACNGNKIKILLLAVESNSKVIGPPFPVNDMEISSLYEGFNVQRLKHEVANKIPERLIKKGYRDMIETVYLISEKLN